MSALRGAAHPFIESSDVRVRRLRARVESMDELLRWLRARVFDVTTSMLVRLRHALLLAYTAGDERLAGFEPQGATQS